ncbi:MAG TPA: sialidase family protein [Ktedonobacterales bacterium]|nr:sialidase family protein [Ktedonobacterales bacterium]
MAGIRSGGRCWGSLALIIGALGLLLAGCGQVFPVANTAPPSGWTDITPPDSGQRAQYAVSPDIPGLIIATIGGRAQTSADPPPAARLWRSVDGGASWQSLDSLSPRSGSSLIMPPGGHGLVISVDVLDASVSISRDEGMSWRTVPVNTISETLNPPTLIDWLSGAVGLNGRLYTSSGRFFSVSDDGGLTWRTIETDADPTVTRQFRAAIAPLDSSGASWLRFGSKPNATNTPVVVERSDDGGTTWRIIAPPLPITTTVMYSARLATSGVHPGRVCAAVTVNDSAPNVAAPPTVTPASTAPPQPSVSPGTQGAVSYPAPLDKDVVLLTSDDDGATWHGGVVEALRRRFGGAVPPGVQMSADGSCYLATQQQSSPFDVGVDVLATLWRLAPGAAQPVAQWAMAGRLVQFLALAPNGAGAGERVIALTRISGPGDGDSVSCGPGCTTLHDGGFYRLIWQPLALSPLPRRGGGQGERFRQPTHNSAPIL